MASGHSDSSYPIFYSRRSNLEVGRPPTRLDGSCRRSYMRVAATEPAPCLREVAECSSLPPRPQN